MTDTTEPPRRPASPRPAGGKPRPRTDSDARSERPRGGASLTRGAEPAPPKDDARIAKVMARAGLCSRRDAEGWIAEGRVAVNGAVIDSPALNVKPGDRITVDGQPLPEREVTRLFLFHKPRGLVTTARDPEGRPTIFDHLPEGLPRLVSVGRLDINTEGLMLLTNDGGLARVLELPQTGWLRRYRVRANGDIDQARLDALKGGVTVDGVDYAGIEATLDRVQGANAWLTMGLREGKNREIKRVLESLGLAVTRLIRISFGPFQLGELAEGAVESVPARVLRDQLGPALAAEAGVDLDARDEPAPRRGARRDDGAAPARPSRMAPDAPRPYVGAMRAAREEAAAGEGRKRVLRGATADRRGRAVKVERVVPVDGGSRADTRNGRRFAAEKAERAPGRTRTRVAEEGFGAARRPRRDGEEAERPRGPRAGRFDPKARGDGADRFDPKARGDDRARAPRPERAGGFGDRARPPRGERTEGFGAAGRAERSGSFGGEARVPRNDRPGGFKAGGRGERDGFGERPARSGKPNGRPGGFGSDRPVTGRNKRDERRPGGAPEGGERRPGGPPKGAPRGGGRPGGARPPRTRT